MPVPKIALAAFGGTSLPLAGATRRLAASALTAASDVLARWADSLVAPLPTTPGPLPRLEFHAEDGAPDGALYLDGEWIGTLRGVGRL